jgi:hypothetical protein
MDALVNASLGAIGLQRNISLEWPAVRWLSGQWPLLFPVPDPMERAIMPANSLSWAVYVYAVYLSAARAAGSAGNWAQPQLLANIRASILAFARITEPGPDAPPAVCAPMVAAVAAIPSMAVPAGRRAPRAPRAVHPGISIQKEELTPKGLGASDFARATGLTLDMAKRLLAGRASLTRDIAERWATSDASHRPAFERLYQVLASGLEHADAATRSTRRGPIGSRGKPATGKAKASASPSTTRKAVKTRKRGKARSTKRSAPER